MRAPCTDPAPALRLLTTAVALTLSACTDTDPLPTAAPVATATSPDTQLTGYEADCQSLCEEMVARGCDDETTCAPGCISANQTAGACAEPLGAYVACLAANRDAIPSCFDFPAECEAAYLDWAGCGQDEDACGIIKCDNVGPDACSCWGICQTQQIRETCHENGGVFDCQCTVDDEVVAECASTSLACPFFVGCCAPHLP